MKLVQEAVVSLVAKTEKEDIQEEEEEGEAGPGPSRNNEHVMVHYFASRALRR